MTRVVAISASVLMVLAAGRADAADPVQAATERANALRRQGQHEAAFEVLKDAQDKNPSVRLVAQMGLALSANVT